MLFDFLFTSAVLAASLVSAAIAVYTTIQAASNLMAWKVLFDDYTKRNPVATKAAAETKKQLDEHARIVSLHAPIAALFWISFNVMFSGVFYLILS
jgi:uncharacterized membrane protein